MKHVLAGLAVILTLGAALADVRAEAPRVVRSTPADGATGVPVDVGRVRIVFNVNMKMTTWSLVTARQLPFPPLDRDEGPWLDPLTFDLKLKPLKPATTYAIGLNSGTRRGFQSAEDAVTLPPTVITFTTAGEGSGRQPSAAMIETVPSPAARAPLELGPHMPPAPRPPLAPADTAPSAPQAGWRFEVALSSGLKGNFYPQGMAPVPLQYFLQVRYTEDLVRIDAGRVVEVTRDVATAEVQGVDPATGQATRSELVAPGQHFRVTYTPEGAVMVDASSGQEILDEALLGVFSPPPAPDLWPAGPLAAGQRWSYTGAELNRRLRLIDARGGQIDLTVERIEPEPGTGLLTAFIRGRLQTTINFEPTPLDFDARVEIDLPLVLGIPFMVKFDGKVSGQGTTQDESGRPLPFTVQGDGTLLQIAKPFRAVLDAAGDGLSAVGAVSRPPDAAPPTAATPASGALTGPVQSQNVAAGSGGSVSDRQAPQTLQAPAGRSTGGAGQSVFLSLYREQYQGAFYMLVPKGWKTEGGMIPSGVQWNVVDLVENNIRFRATSPDGRSFFGWYPRFYFQDPNVSAQSSMGILQKQPGEVINGCWLYPYMSLEDYVRLIVLGHFGGQEFQNARLLGRAAAAPELQPFVPQGASRSQCGYVNFACTVNGIPSVGRIYAIIYDIQGVLWSTVGTFGWVAPESRWQEDERIMELCIRSFRLDPQWARRAADGARYRAEGYNNTIREMHRIDAEINANRAQARSDMQEEFYKVITDQIETLDPQTGQVKYLPMYHHAYTDGRGNYILKDTDDGTLPVENASEWRQLQIVNRNDPNYRPVE